MAFGLCLVMALAAGAGAVCRAETAEEYQLKAAFVSKFPQFTEWPDSALTGRDTIDVCVARPNPFGAALSDLVVGEMLGGRRLVTREIDAPGAIDRCHVLFVTGQLPNTRRAMLARAARLPVLTVGDYPEFLREGGVINLRIVDGRVRFEVNVEASNRVGLRLASQLLRLATSVQGGTQ